MVLMKIIQVLLMCNNKIVQVNELILILIDFKQRNYLYQVYSYVDLF